MFNEFSMKSCRLCQLKGMSHFIAYIFLIALHMHCSQPVNIDRILSGLHFNNNLKSTLSRCTLNYDCLFFTGSRNQHLLRARYKVLLEAIMAN